MFEAEEVFEVGDGRYLIVELEEKIDSIILYRWNRVYPADTYFDIDLSGWQLVRTGEFSGASHELITKEVYTR